MITLLALGDSLNAGYGLARDEWVLQCQFPAANKPALPCRAADFMPALNQQSRD